MVDVNFDLDEYIILEEDNIHWISRNEIEIEKIILTNKKIYCPFKKSNGIFRKPIRDVYQIFLSDIIIDNRQAMVLQTKKDGAWCLQIHTRQGLELFEFVNSPKKMIPKWVESINQVLGTEPILDSTKKRHNILTSVFSNTLNEVSGSFKAVIDTAVENLGLQGKTSTISLESSTSQQTSNDNNYYVQQNNTNNALQKFCVNCGFKLVPHTKFCPNCGTKISSDNSIVHSQEHIYQTDEEQVTPSTDFKLVENHKDSYSSREQVYVGKVFKCPHCGTVVNHSDTICDGCGYHLSGKQAISSAADFQQQLLKVEMTRKNKKIGFWDQREVLDATDKQIIALIKSYPVPNSIEDIVEFFHLAIGNIDVSKSKKSLFNTDGWDGGSREREISNAWIGKLQQIYKKAELFFPNEPEFSHIQTAYNKIMKELRK